MFFSSLVALELVVAGGAERGAGEPAVGDMGARLLTLPGEEALASLADIGDVIPVAGSGADVTIVVLVRGNEYGEYLCVVLGAKRGPR